MSIDQYLSLFLQLFDTGIPWTVICITLLVATCVSGYLYHKGNRQVIVHWILAYLFLMLYTTVIRRFQYVSEVSRACEVHLMPLWSIQAIQEGYIETLYEKIYNVLFFVPYGMPLAAYRRFKGGKGFKVCRGSVLIGCLTSVTIELLQFVTRTGTCETDDVICNTVGCAIGAVFGVAICWMIRKNKKQVNG